MIVLNAYQFAMLVVMMTELNSDMYCSFSEVISDDSNGPLFALPTGVQVYFSDGEFWIPTRQYGWDTHRKTMEWLDNHNLNYSYEEAAA